MFGTRVSGTGVRKINIHHLFYHKEMSGNGVNSWQRNSILLLGLLMTLSGLAVPGSSLDVAGPGVKLRDSEVYTDSVSDLGYNGSGITIAILDSGVDDGHPSLEGAFVGGSDHSLGLGLEGNPDDMNGHGTHVAGIVLGRGGGPEDPNYNFTGMAPGASLVDVKVAVGPDVLGFDSFIVQGLQWCIRNRDANWSDQDPENDGIDIICLALNNDNSSDGSAQITELINQASEMGMVVVVSAGDEGPDNQGFDDMAAAGAAITVGALDDAGTVDRGDDSSARWSARGPGQENEDPSLVLKPDVVAPGVNISSAEGTLLFPPEGYVEMSGTAMAAGLVTGIAALVLEANPELNPEQVKHILRETAEKRGEADFPETSKRYNTSYGFGMVDAYQAVRAAKHPVDLVISSFSYEPREPKEGDFLTLKFNATNRGLLTSSGGFLSLIFQYQDFVQARTFSLELGPGRSRDYTYFWPFTDAWPGSHTITLRASSGLLPDSVPENNLRTLEPYVLSRPELVAKDLSLEKDSVTEGEILHLNFTIENTGDLGTIVTAELYFNVPGGPNMAAEKKLVLGGNKTLTSTFNVRAPIYQDEDPTEVYVKVYFEDTLFEANTWDNSASAMLKVNSAEELPDEDKEEFWDTVVCGGCCSFLIFVLLASVWPTKSTKPRARPTKRKWAGPGRYPRNISCPSCEAEIRVEQHGYFVCQSCQKISYLDKDGNFWLDVELPLEEEDDVEYVKIPCPYCSRELQVRKQGLRYRCPHCDNLFRQKGDEEEEEEMPVARLVWTGKCPGCSRELRVLGMGNFSCPSCKKELEHSKGGRVQLRAKWSADDGLPKKEEIESSDPVEGKLAGEFPVIINCRHCKSKMRVAKFGKFRCPACKEIDQVDKIGDFVEENVVHKRFFWLRSCPSCQKKMRIIALGTFRCPACGEIIEILPEGKVEKKEPTTLTAQETSPEKDKTGKLHTSPDFWEPGQSRERFGKFFRKDFLTTLESLQNSLDFETKMKFRDHEFIVAKMKFSTGGKPSLEEMKDFILFVDRKLEELLREDKHQEARESRERVLIRELALLVSYPEFGSFPEPGELKFPDNIVKVATDDGISSRETGDSKAKRGGDVATEEEKEEFRAFFLLVDNLLMKLDKKVVKAFSEGAGKFDIYMKASRGGVMSENDKWRFVSMVDRLLQKLPHREKLWFLKEKKDFELYHKVVTRYRK